MSQQHPRSKNRYTRTYHRRKSHSRTFAALDLGTNNCRLLIARPSIHGHNSKDWDRPYYGEPGMPFRVVDAFSRIVRLGEGLALTGALSENAIDRTLTALMICASKMRRRNVTTVRCIATEACRRATNCDAFLKRVKSETSLSLEIISGEEEAALGLIGCLPLMNPKRDSALIFDIGGGSTEVSLMQLDANKEFDLAGTVSIPFGVVTLSETYGGQMDPHRADGGTLSATAYQHIQNGVTDRLRAFDQQFSVSERLRNNRLQMIGTSGTVTTLAGINLRLRHYDRAQVDGTYLSMAAMQKTIDELVATSNNGRAAYPCIGPRRADLVLPGCAVLQAILNLWPVAGLRVADRGLREGMLYTMSSSFV